MTKSRNISLKIRWGCLHRCPRLALRFDLFSPVAVQNHVFVSQKCTFPWMDKLLYRRSTNLACGGAKTFSHPPYSQYGFIYFQTESCFEHFGGFDMALPRGFLNFYLEPPNLPPFIPKWPPHQEPKNRWNFFSWFLFIFWLNSVIWCLYQLSMIFFWFVMQFFIKKIYFENSRI